MALLLAAACSAGDGLVARSTARVDLGGTELAFDVDCHDVGAGAVIVVGEGSDPASGQEARLLVQAFLADSYLGVAVGSDNGFADLYEVSLEHVLDLFLVDGRIAADGLPMVRNLDLATGEGEVVGTGALEVTCVAFRRGPPEGYPLVRPNG